MDNDIPLRDLQVTWSYDGRDPAAPPIRLMAIGDRDDPDYSSSWGACNADFDEANDETKLGMLFAQFHQIVTLDKIDPQAVHQAFLRIPEYRRAIAIDLIPEKYRHEREFT